MIRIAVLSDLHAASGCWNPNRRGDMADILLLRTVRRINRHIRPDVTLILGDLLDSGDSPDGEDRLRAMKAALDQLDMPWMAIPGNHDGPLERFSRIFGPAPKWFDVGDMRLIPFVDPEAAEFNARRAPADLERMRAARSGHDGPMIAFQHVPLHPPGRPDCPYNYENAEEVIAAMRQAGITLSISGHFHAGRESLRDGDIHFLTVPALCESPFRFLELEFDGENLRTVPHEHKLPEGLGLVDTHVHSHFAYCGENMEIGRALALARDFGLAGLVLTEHSGHLYLDESYWDWGWFVDGMANARPETCRVEAYRAACLGAGARDSQIGLEVECDMRGDLMLRPADRERMAFINGSIHRMRFHERGSTATPEQKLDEFLFLTSRIIGQKVDALAHGFRLHPGEPTPRTIAIVVRLLRENGVAAELNFHNGGPPPAFIRGCIDAGVKVTLGSDSHNLCHVGDFHPHLKMLREECGYDGDLRDILLRPAGCEIQPVT